MAAKKITARVVVATGDVAGLVDRGHEVDIQKKNLDFEDKGIKTKLGEAADGLMEDGEMSIRLEGEKAAALVSVSEKYDIDASCPEFPDVDKAVRAGVLSPAVSIQRTLCIPQDKVEAAFALLKSAGLPDVSLQVGYVIDPEEYRVLSGSVHSDPAKAAAVEALKKSVVCKSGTRISYSGK